MVSLLALPLTYTATRNGLRAIPRHLREASYALGKTRITTIRRVLLPSLRRTSRPARRSAWDGSSAARRSSSCCSVRRSRTSPRTAVPLVGFLRGTGSTLTSYVLNSPAGEGNAPQKAYAAAFVLLLIILVLNAVVGRISRIGASESLYAGRLAR